MIANASTAPSGFAVSTTAFSNTIRVPNALWWALVTQTCGFVGILDGRERWTPRELARRAYHQGSGVRRCGGLTIPSRCVEADEVADTRPLRC